MHELNKKKLSQRKVTLGNRLSNSVIKLLININLFSNALLPEKWVTCHQDVT